MFPAKFFSFDPRELWQTKEGRRLILSGLAVLLLATVTLILLWGPSRKEEFTLSLEENQKAAASASPESLVVDIAGGVRNPGVYQLTNGSIVEDAILMAGGFASSVDLKMVEQTVNRAELLENHSKIYIPRRDDQLALSEGFSSLPASSLSPQASGLININTANQAQLDLLPGIGPATAQNILDFRKMNGNFKRKEDLKLVPGIGDSKYEKMKDLISL